MGTIMKDLRGRVSKAVSHYWMTIRPWLGYIFMLEDCKESRS